MVSREKSPINRSSRIARRHPPADSGPADGIRRDVPMRIDLLDAGQAASAEAGLAELLIDCVAGGASVGFLASLGQDEAQAWWRMSGPAQPPLRRDA
jgi:hypothetical protein